MSTANHLKDFIVRLAACFLVLWTPFFFFSAFRGHPVPVASLLDSAFLFGVAALAFALLIGRGHGLRRVGVFTLIVCLFLDLQFSWFDGAVAYVGALLLAGVFWMIREHLAVIVASVFATVLLTSFLGTAGEQYVDRKRVTDQNILQDTPTATGSFVHVIADGFAGLGGIPDEIAGSRELKDEIEAFFRAYDFELHPNAISEYAASRASISGILNFEGSPTPEQNYHGRRPFVLKHNPYFEWLHGRGFEIDVTQSTYLDYCAESPVALNSCFTYRYDGTDWLRDAALDDDQKMSVLLGMFFNLPGFFESVWKGYVKVRRTTEKIGLTLPPILAWDGIVAPVASISAFGEFRESVLTSPAGHAHFAHLLMPHSPYVFDANCQLRGEPLGWLGSHPLYEKDNTPEGRRLRYEQYFGQVRCTLEQLRPLFDGLKAQGRWAATEIVVHGDHGSRLYETAPRAKNRDRLTPPDLADGFSTLFAAKSRRAQWSDQAPVTPISRLLARFVGAAAESGEGEGPPSVYLEAQNDEPWMAMPWPNQP